MKILVTGGDGYIGSHCVLALLRNGYDVVTFDSHETGHPEISAMISKDEHRGKHFESVKGNLLKEDEIESVFKSFDIDAVIHFAAFSQVGESMKNPGKYYRNNVCGTINLLDSMIANDVKKIVFSSTAATYGEPEYVPIDENHVQRPINPYGRSKLMIENIMDDYDKAYGLRSVRLRYFNVVGADSQGLTGEWHDPETHLIPNILKSVLEDGKAIELFGDDYPTRDGTCVRDYVNVEDLVDAHILALNYLNDGGKTDYFNLGTKDGYTVKEVLSECERVVGKTISPIIRGRRPGDPASLVADNTKAMKVLGWSPKRSLSDSISTAYEWEKKRHGF